VWIGPTDPILLTPTVELWFDSDAPTGEGGLAPSMWSWNAIEDPPLAQGRLAVNTAPGDAITMLYLNSHDLTGIDWSLTVSGLQADDEITLQYAVDAASWHRYVLTDVPYQDGDTWVFPVLSVDGSPAGSAPPVGSPILVSFAATSAGRPSSYTHAQGSPATVWVIPHNLGFRPNVTVEDSAGTTIEGEIVHDSADQLTLTFSAAFSGVAYLS
jgi:hypothetical protein